MLLREASNARNLRDLLPLVAQYGPERCAFCTDDREADVLVGEGHIDQMLRLALSEGIPVETALVLATLNGALCHGLRDIGAIAPGYRADFALHEDESFVPKRVYKDGVAVVADGRVEPIPSAPAPEFLTQTMRVAPLGDDAFALSIGGGARVRVIEIIPGQLLTRALEEEPSMDDGAAVADVARDLAKIAVVERHHATGRIGCGLVRGFGLRAGAFATTVSHDAHNVIVVGVSDADMLACVRRLAEIGGGLAVARDGAVVAELPLPIAGLMSGEPAADVAAALTAAQDTLRSQGVAIAAPFMTLSFLGLSVIPSLKLTDRGLVDVDRFALVPLEV